MRVPGKSLQTSFLAIFALLAAPMAIAQPQATWSQTPLRITEDIDDSIALKIPHTTHPLAAPANDRGRADANLPMKRILLLLKPSNAQRDALQKLIGSQHDPDSANYQKWLTPEEYAAQFGSAADDLDRITSWLQQHNFTVDAVARGGQWIEFSGSAAQVEAAFHTEIHNYVVKGERHVANATDISLPQALAPVVRGILSLHDFRAKPLHAGAYPVRRDPATGKLVPVVGAHASAGSKALVSPDFTPPPGFPPGHLLAPGDWAKIYSTAPLLAHNVRGSGIEIAIVGSDSDLQLSDIRTFRQMFQLPPKDPTFIVNGLDPGVSPGSSAEIEGDLDVEWSGAVAPEATIKFVTSASTPATFGAFLSIAYIVDHRVAPIMSISFGACEAFLGPGGNAFLNSVYEQAAAEGISVFVASGDNGAAGCDPQVSFSPAIFGPNVSGFASTPFNVAVGGTMFAENGQDARYWNTDNRPDLSSAIGYIPETVWDETCDPTVDPNQCGGSFAYFLSAGSGGPSSCVQSMIQSDGTILCQAGYPKPAWQAGQGVPNDSVRDIPDLALASAGGHDGYLMCVEGSCQTTTSGGQTVIQSAFVVGGTSAASPSMAGVMALVEQAKGAYQGLINFNLYKLAAADNLSACNSSNLVNPNQPSDCNFNDVTVGNNNVPGQVGYDAGLGFDLATGLGSVNAENLVSGWGTAAKLGTKTRLDANPGRGEIQHGQPIPINVVVSPASGGGAPSGDFALTAAEHGWLFGGTLADGRFSGNVTGLPGGDYRVSARYSGDAMFASSNSETVRVKVTPEDSVVNVQPLEVNFANSVVPVTGPLVYGQPFGLQVDIQGKSGVGSATGALSVQMDGTRSFGPFPLNQSGSAFVELDGLGLGVPQSLRSTGLLTGDHTFKVSYSGDNSFREASAAPVTVTVNRVATETRIIPVQTVYTDGVPIDFIFLVSQGGIEGPTGFVQFFDCIEPNQCLQNVPISGRIELSSTGPLGGPGTAGSQATYRGAFSAGTHTLRLAYYGDSNYSPVVLNSHFSIRTTINVNPLAGMRVEIGLRQSPGTITVGQTEHYVVTVRPLQPHSPLPMGTVCLSDQFGDFLGAPISLTEGQASFDVPWFFAGPELIFANYSGDMNYAPLNSVTHTTTVKPGEPTVTLTAEAAVVRANSTSRLTVTVVGPPPGSKIGSPAAEGGAVIFFDSLNGAEPIMLGTDPQPLTTANGGDSVRIFPVVLPPGKNVITAKFLGTPDWVPTVSNTLVVLVQKPDRDSDHDVGK